VKHFYVKLEPVGVKTGSEMYMHAAWYCSLRHS